MATIVSTDLSEIVKRYWGYDSLRPLQAEAMDCVLRGCDSLVVLPTGGGKSLCFQAPALAMDGMAIVVSPLISLMKDQVDSLIQSSVADAATLHSGLSPEERWEVERITCREGSGENLSFGDKDAKIAIYGIDTDEKVTCTFVVRDKTVPRKGPWQVTETSSRARCRVPIEVEAGETEELQLRVRGRGRRLIAGPVRLTRVSEDEGRYRGRRRQTRIDWQVRSDKHITGTTTTKVGRGCKIIRKFDMRYQGD